MAIGIFLEYGGRIVQFPVNPEEIELTGESNNNLVEVIQLGEVNELGIRKLKDVSFESFLPADKNSGGYIQTKNKWWTPKQYIDFIEKIRTEQKPARFVVTDTEINLMVSVESFDFRHQAGNSEDVYFTLGLKEFKNFGAKTVKLYQPVSSNSNKSNSTSNKISVGDEVIANGRLHADSWGRGPGLTEVNARRVVTHIAEGREYPIHLALPGGTSSESTRFSHWRGWVTTGSVRKA